MEQRNKGDKSMKFSRRIKICNNNEDIEIIIKYNTKNLYCEEHKTWFNKFYDKIMEALLNNYHYEDIKVTK